MSIRSPRAYMIVLLLLAALLLPACSQSEPEPEEDPSQPTVIEEGATAHQGEEETAQPVDPFPDKGEAATLEDLNAALANVESYYFEQNMSYPSGQVFMQVWYKDGLMKLVTSVDGYCLTESYYDYEQGRVVDVSPGDRTAAHGRDFDPNSENAPNNPKMEDYTAGTSAGGETVGRQYCRIVETASGDKLWVSTKYGFPLRVEYTDSLGERYQVDYKNLSINTVSDEDVALPADLEIVYN